VVPAPVIFHLTTQQGKPANKKTQQKTAAIRARLEKTAMSGFSASGLKNFSRMSKK
jgi:hypothetical protein